MSQTAVSLLWTVAQVLQISHICSLRPAIDALGLSAARGMAFVIKIVSCKLLVRLYCRERERERERESQREREREREREVRLKCAKTLFQFLPHK